MTRRTRLLAIVALDTLAWLVGPWDRPGSCCPFHAAVARRHIPRRGWE